jgi:hypothetical protein
MEDNDQLHGSGSCCAEMCDVILKAFIVTLKIYFKLANGTPVVWTAVYRLYRLGYLDASGLQSTDCTDWVI